jgi:L-rhamnose mutarotase
VCWREIVAKISFADSIPYSIFVPFGKRVLFDLFLLKTDAKMAVSIEV